MFTVGSSTSATFVLPVRHGTGVALQKRVWTVSQNPQSNRVANETPWQQWRRQGCCTERLWNQRMQIFYVEYDDQAEARATSSSRLDNSHWIAFFTLRHGTGVALQKRVWTVPKILNRTELQMRRHGNNEEGKGAAQKGFETRGCIYFMWSMMTKLKHVQQAAADLTIPTE